MLINSSVTTWQELCDHLEINSLSLSDEDISKLQKWCCKHIQSNFSGTNEITIKKLVTAYLKLNNNDSVASIVDVDTGYTVLHQAAKAGFNKFIEHLPSLDSRIINSQAGKIGNTALHLAAIHGHLAIAELLLELKADANITNTNNKCPLHFVSPSSEYKNDRLLLVDLLLDKTAEKHFFTKLDNENDTSLALMLTAFNDVNIMTKVLYKHPDLLNIKDINGENVLHKSIILQKAALIDYFSTDKTLLAEKTRDYSTCLHLACRYGDIACIEKFIAICDKSQQTMVDNNYQTPKQYLEKRRDLKLSEETIESLFSTQPDADSMTKSSSSHGL